MLYSWQTTLDTLPEWAHDMLTKEIPNEVLTGISPDGREGPGSYGLNRNVAQTVLIAKDGKVLHNFAFTQPMLYSDPHFLGAVADAIGADAPALEKWLNDEGKWLTGYEIINPTSATVEKWLDEEGKWLTGYEITNPTSATVEKWLDEEPADEERMQRGTEELIEQLNAFQEGLQRLNESTRGSKSGEPKEGP